MLKNCSLNIQYILLLAGEVNTGQFRYSDWLLSGQYNTVKTTSEKNGIFWTTNIITKKKLSPANEYNNNWLVGQYGKYWLQTKYRPSLRGLYVC